MNDEPELPQLVTFAESQRYVMICTTRGIVRMISITEFPSDGEKRLLDRIILNHATVECIKQGTGTLGVTDACRDRIYLAFRIFGRFLSLTPFPWTELASQRRKFDAWCGDKKLPKIDYSKDGGLWKADSTITLKRKMCDKYVSHVIRVDNRTTY